MTQIFEGPTNRARLVNMVEAAEYFSCSRRHLERLLAAGIIRCVRVGRLVRLDLQEVESDLKARGERRETGPSSQQRTGER